MRVSLADYERAVAPARELLALHPTLRTVTDPQVPRELLTRFLLEFSALGVQMTEPVEGWIRRAGERCVATGTTDLGHRLIAHSRQERGHHLMLIADTRTLVAGWNARHATRERARTLLARPATKSTRDYIALHEETLASDAPFAQVAIELEIERMSVVFGGPFLANCRAVLDPDILEGLSFIEEHVEIDVGHTHYNGTMMAHLLEMRPDALDTLVDRGSCALRAYVGFFQECFELAKSAVDASPDRMAML